MPDQQKDIPIRAQVFPTVIGGAVGNYQRRYDMRHEMLTQRALFCHRANTKRGMGHADSAFCDACRTSSGPCTNHMIKG